MATIRMQHQVADFDAWKRLFDSDPLDRPGSGVRSYRISRPVGDDQTVIVDLDFDSPEEATTFKGRLEALWQFLAQGIDTMPCQTCYGVQQIPELVLGFPPPDRDLAEVVKQAVAAGVAGVQSMLQDAIMIVLRAVGSEAREGPRLFSLLPCDAGRFNPFNIKLELPLRLINIDKTCSQNRHPVFRPEFHLGEIALPHNARQHRIFIFKQKVTMPAVV